MTRVVLLGTSHVAALWQGWGEIEARWPGITVTCFAVPGRDGNAARLRGTQFGYFGPRAGEVKVFGHDAPAIELTEFDHVVRVGRSFPEAAVVPLLKDHAIDGVTPATETRSHLLSRHAGAEMIAAIASGAMPPPEWRTWTDPAVTILQTPYPDSRFPGASVAPRQAGRQWLAQRPEEMLAVRAIFLAALTAALAEHGIGFLPQPGDTLGPDGLSLLRYSEGSLRLADGTDHDTTDILHMNADYGALVMERLMDHLTRGESTTPARAASA